MIYLCVEPGLSYPLFSDSLAAELTALGREATFVRLGNRHFDHAVKRCCSFSDRLSHGIAAFSTIRLFSNGFLKTLRPGDIVTIYETFGLVSGIVDGWLHQQIKERGARLVCLMQDAWPVVPSRAHVKATRIRLSVANLIGAVTPTLKDYLQDYAPDVRVVLMEEAIDIEAFSPDFSSNEPVIVWSGPPPKQTEVLENLPVLESVFRQLPFRLRIASGHSSPKIRTIIPIEWIPFSRSLADQFAGTSIAFARYKDTLYGRCKGNYKIKTYLAAGCAIVSDPVGYNHELIQPGVNGLFANKAEEWETAFLRLLRNPEERLSMRKASRDLAVKRFSYKAIAKQYACVLRDSLLACASTSSFRN